MQTLDGRHGDLVFRKGLVQRDDIGLGIAHRRRAGAGINEPATVWPRVN
jgi:hypothetical protein